VVWKPALRAAGVDDTERSSGMHRARHTFAFALLSEGESIAAVSEWLGHSSPTVTLNIYAHFMPESEDRTRRLIDTFAASCVTSVSQELENQRLPA
jgi:integrase